MPPHPNCEPQHHCYKCGKPVLCGEDIVVPWRSWTRYKPRHADCDGMTGWRRIYHCSKACYWRQLRARRKAEREPIAVICEACGGRFEPPRRGARYCSSACRQDAYRQRKAGP
jgi:hypothetical protein